MYIPLVLKILQKGTLFGKFSAMLELGVKLWFSKLWDKKYYQAEFHAVMCGKLSITSNLPISDLAIHKNTSIKCLAHNF